MARHRDAQHNPQRPLCARPLHRVLYILHCHGVDFTLPDSRSTLSLEDLFMVIIFVSCRT